MPVRIRLQRHGKKGKPFYWIVAADGRAKRDGRYLEKIGTYNPNTNPATVELDVDQAVKWLENGAQPSDTARTLLSYRGAMIKHHLNGGVKKGAFSQEEADKRFAAWLEEKQAKIQAKIDGLDKTKANDLAQRLEAEKAVNQKRIADLTAPPEAEQAEEGDTAEVAAETATEEAAATETATEAVQEETAADEAPAQEAPAVEESKAEEVPAEAPKTDEAPAAEETKSEDAPAEEEETK
jgi:small subunit ribosomal protein S16